MLDEGIYGCGIIFFGDEVRVWNLEKITRFYLKKLNS